MSIIEAIRACVKEDRRIKHNFSFSYNDPLYYSKKYVSPGLINAQYFLSILEFLDESELRREDWEVE